ncbi:MAG: DUF4339 domain-containing protein, partial [Verrucomicrobiales bacterium]|nr:DUF4339 domain-containing protein [Verrucomicrobiales bacterium]
MQLYISRGEEISGPFSYEQVQDYLTAGVLFSEDLACWHDGTGGWMPLGELMAQTPGHTTPPPALTQPEPAIATTPANSSTKKKLLIGISAVVTVLAIAAGAGIWFWLGLDKDKSPANNPNPGAEIKANSDQEPEGVAAKLTAAEASEILGEDIGRWKMTGKHMPNPDEEDVPDAEPFESIFEVRWKVEGKSLACIWAMVINGKKVQFVGYKDFDAKKGVFTWRTKGDGFPEMITRERYDRQTKTLFWEFTYPDGTKEASTFQIVNKDKRLQKTQATRNGKVVFRNEATFTRMASEPEPSNPIIAKLTPAEAAEVMAWEIGKWETKGQAKQLGEKEGGGLIETKFETESSMECAWKEEGRSLEFKFSMTQGGEAIIFFGRKHYDAAKGVFIYRQWGERMPESISHERYDLATRTFYAETAPVIPPIKTRSTAVTKRIGNNKTQQRLEVREGDQLVYAHDIVSTRINTPPTEVNPNLGKIESPEALAKRTLDALSKNDFPALSKLGAESLPKEVLMDTMVNLRYAVTEENIKLTAQRRNITEEEAKEYLKEKIQKEKARMEEMYEKGIKEETADRKLSFDRVITEGKKQANIEWGKVSFVRLEGKPFEKNGIKGGDFFIVLAYQGNNFKIKLDDCMHYPKHGWFLTHGPDWGDGTDDAGPPDETSEGESSHEEPAQPEPAPNAPAKGLVAYYPFNGNARNESANDHHGQVFGAKLTADRHGKANSAYQFKPGDHIKIDGLMGKPKNLTLSAWVKLDGQQGRLGSEIISLGDIAVLRADNKSPYSQRAGTGGVFFGGEKFWVHTMAKANYTGTGWHQIIFTFDDEANAQVTYVDGAQMVSKKNPKSIVYEGGGTDTFIGIHGKTAKLNWRSQGIIDDLRVYDRALTAAEVKALFRSEKPAFPLQAGNPIKVTTIAELRAKAQAGDAQAQVSLGLKFINGADGLNKNPQATEKLWLRAAKQGQLTAQMNLGLLYSRGALGEKDPLKAYQWAKLSFQGGHQRAKQLAETLEKELTPEQIAEAEQFIKTFKPVVEEHGDIPAPVDPSKPIKKLTPEEISEALSLRVGTFKVTEKESAKVLETFTGTWVKKGLSTEFRNTGENKAGAIVTYDPVKNLFIENFENGASIHQSKWNPLTKTLVRRMISPKSDAGESVTM